MNAGLLEKLQNKYVQALDDAKGAARSVVSSVKKVAPFVKCMFSHIALMCFKSLVSKLEGVQGGEMLLPRPRMPRVLHQMCCQGSEVWAERICRNLRPPRMSLSISCECRLIRVYVNFKRNCIERDSFRLGEMYLYTYWHK